MLFKSSLSFQAVGATERVIRNPSAIFVTWKVILLDVYGSTSGRVWSAKGAEVIRNSSDLDCCGLVERTKV